MENQIKATVERTPDRAGTMAEYRLIQSSEEVIGTTEGLLRVGDYMPAKTVQALVYIAKVTIRLAK